MNSNVRYENASQRKTYVGYVYDAGERAKKEEILSSLPEEWSRLHNDGHIHIHDLDAYGLTYNCLTFDLLRRFPYKEFEGLSEHRRIIKLFTYYKELISKVGNEQSGGMAFANFDQDTAAILSRLDVTEQDSNLELLADCISDLIEWCNASHERMGQVSYYVTLNIGLAEGRLASFICESVIRSFGTLPNTVFKPNIVFKVKGGVNYHSDDCNRYLLDMALECTSRKMIPTYLICDCPADRDIDPSLLSVMGCRTRVVSDIYGHPGAIGRGNIDNISINLPRLAFESLSVPVSERFSLFKQNWINLAKIVTDILLDRYYKTLKMEPSDFPTVNKYGLWTEELDDLAEAFKHGTLSIGFIGLSEAFEIMFGRKIFTDPELRNLSLDFVSFMREYTDSCTERYRLNFSLLATSGELISGRFCDIDSKIYIHPVLEKGYYTNSFHIDVDSGLTSIEKISVEGPYHRYCNGGSITYVELGEAPIGNVEGLMEMVECAVESGTRYLGFNFPQDICKSCGESGVFDVCPNCRSEDILRIRRVSGYLEVLDFFVSGKKNEVANRRRN